MEYEHWTKDEPVLKACNWKITETLGPIEPRPFVTPVSLGIPIEDLLDFPKEEE